MKLVNINYFDPIEIDELTPTTLVIENPTLYRNVITSLITHLETGVGNYFLSDGLNELKIDKNILLITDVYHLTQNLKQIKTKLQQQIISIESTNEKQIVLHSILTEYAYQIMENLNYEIKFKDILLGDLIKFLDFDINLSELSFYEKFIEYVKVCTDLLGFKLIITVNLQDGLSEENYIQLIHDLSNRKIKLLMIERHEYTFAQDFSAVEIIDNDLCMIK